jgi:hypothetical protein
MFVTTSHETLIELSTIFSDLLDNSLDSTINGKVDFTFDFNIDIHELVNEYSNYSLFNAFTQNCHIRLLWNIAQFRENAKRVLKTINFF